MKKNKENEPDPYYVEGGSVNWAINITLSSPSNLAQHNYSPPTGPFFVEISLHYSPSFSLSTKVLFYSLCIYIQLLYLQILHLLFCSVVMLNCLSDVKSIMLECVWLLILSSFSLKQLLISSFQLQICCLFLLVC